MFRLASPNLVVSRCVVITTLRISNQRHQPDELPINPGITQITPLVGYITQARNLDHINQESYICHFVLRISKACWIRAFIMGWFTAGFLKTKLTVTLQVNKLSKWGKKVRMATSHGDDLKFWKQSKQFSSSSWLSLSPPRLLSGWVAEKSAHCLLHLCQGRSPHHPVQGQVITLLLS